MLLPNRVKLAELNVYKAVHQLCGSQHYTVSQKKLGHFYFYCNFGKCWSILKIRLQLESEGSS